MNKKLCSIILIFIFTLGFLYATTSDGPFGLKKGMTYQQIKLIDKNIAEIKIGYYLVTKVPKPHDAFNVFFLIIDEHEGLCKIAAGGKDIQTNGHGTQLKSEYNNIKETLIKKYGTCIEAEALLPSSIWDEPEDWMMSLYKKERYCSSMWSLNNGNELTNNVVAIGLDAHARSTSEGYISLEYEFDNFKEVSERLKENEDDSF